MAQIAAQSDVPALEREGGARVVVEGRRFPIRLVVAQLAVGRELCRRMRRVRRGVVVLQMASHTGGGRSHKSLRVTQIATQTNMPASQWEGRCRIVVEGTGIPGGLRMAGLAIGAEPRLRMHRIGRGIVILLMAGHASRRRAHKSL